MEENMPKGEAPVCDKCKQKMTWGGARGWQFLTTGCEKELQYIKPKAEEKAKKNSKSTIDKLNEAIRNVWKSDMSIPYSRK
jgi:transcription initiation factor IIE alpha subunit